MFWKYVEGSRCGLISLIILECAWRNSEKQQKENQDWSALAKIWTRDLPLIASVNLLCNFLQKTTPLSEQAMKTLTQFLSETVLLNTAIIYKGMSKSFWTRHSDWGQQMLQLYITIWNITAIFWLSLVSSAVVTPCTASQWVLLLCVSNVIHDLIMADLEENCICMEFCFKHWRSATEMIKGILVTMTWTEHRFLRAFLSSNM
jgi:hypothetical protein